MSAVIFENRGHVGWITINRPEAKNIMNFYKTVIAAHQWPRTIFWLSSAQ